MDDKIPVTLIIMDENINYKKSLLQLGEQQFREVINLTSFEELKNYLSKADPELDILLFIHVFRNAKYKGTQIFSHADIQHFYPSLNIHWVTSDKAAQTGEAINAKYDTYRYDDIGRLIKDGKLVSIKVKFIKNNRKTMISNIEQFIFLSHSSEDKDIVNSFYENILRLGFDMSSKNIFFSSNPSTGIKTGEDIPDSLKKALEKMTIFIQYVSENYKKSEVCLNEMGAAWLKLDKNKIIILKSPDIKYDQLGFLNIQRMGLSINKKDDLLKLAEDFKKLFEINSIDYNRKVDKFLKDNNF